MTDDLATGQTNQNGEANQNNQEIKGGRNLFILGVLSVAITVVLSCVALFLYRYSGDVYLDLSRPKDLPTEEEIEAAAKNPKPEANFSDSGKINEDTLNEYLEKLKAEIEYLKKFENPFGDKALSNESLGIPVETEE